ncbi:MAG TPA: hypothetical protein VEC35_17635 [Noviherbaspirillum sp.]|nr:hypothetical protein [Noviherbaspirillum sp.]
MVNLKALAGLAALGGLIYSAFSDERCGEKALQTYFNRLHDEIKLHNFDENAILREKRNLLVQELSDILPNIPAWRVFGQGSYAIGTGIIPRDGAFDIDVGLVFSGISRTEFDPTDLKEIVSEALGRPNRTITIRRPCVTVHYMRDGKEDYHVDLAVYVEDPKSKKLFLAKGKRHSSDELRHWSEQDPEGLLEKIKRRFSGTEAAQFRRCIRYLKAWKNARFRNGGAPISIALTCAAYHWFSPNNNGLFPSVPNDARALRALVESMRDRLATKPEIVLPVTPHSNLLAGMTQKQFDAFFNKLGDLHDALDNAIKMPINEIEVAYSTLDTQFQY